MKNEDVAEKYGLESDDIGVVGKSATYTPSNENSYLCSMRVDAASVVRERDYDMGDEYKFTMVASLFKKLLAEHFDPSHVKSDDVKFWLMVEMPNGFFKDEIKVAVEGSKTDGMYFHISEDEVTGMSKFVPVVNVEEDEDEQD